VLWKVGRVDGLGLGLVLEELLLGFHDDLRRVLIVVIVHVGLVLSDLPLDLFLDLLEKDGLVLGLHVLGLSTAPTWS